MPNVEERKYFVQCLRHPRHMGNKWRYGQERRPDLCPTCGGPVDAILVEVDGVRIREEDRQEAEFDPDAHAIELERQGNEISEQWERDREEEYAGPEEVDEV